MSRLYPLLIVLLSGSLVAADDEQPFALAVYEAELEKQMAEAKGELEQAQAAEGKRYQSTLLKLSEGYQRAGDLEGVLAIRREVERFAEAGKITKTDFSSRPELLAAQKSTLRVLGKIDARATPAELELLRAHGRDLVNLTTKLTKGGQIEAAVQVQNRVDELKSRIDALRSGAASRLRVVPPFEHAFDLSDLEALKKHWVLKAAFKAGENGIKAPRGPANELVSRFEMGGDFEVWLKFQFGQAQYTNTGGTWITVFGQRLNITNGWHSFDMDLRVRRVGAKIISEKNGKVSEHEIPGDKLGEHTAFALWWRSRSCHFKEISVTAQSVRRKE